jgi:hypothetical protein
LREVASKTRDATLKSEAQSFGFAQDRNPKSETISNVRNTNFQNNNRQSRSLKSEYQTAPKARNAILTFAPRQ